MLTGAEINTLVKKYAEEEGFFSCGASSAAYLPEVDMRMKQWTAESKNAAMNYLTKNEDKRADPRLLVSNAKSVISLLMNFFPKEKQCSHAPFFSKYAFGEDYHTVLKEKMHRICIRMKEKIGEFSYRAFVDSAPVAEREWARRSGLGVIGKSGMLIVPQHGSYFFIGEIITDIEMEYDTPLPVQDICKGCRRCQMACPTGAICGDRTIDARKCISYHTIESKDGISEKIKSKMKGKAYGCDICMDVCPWNTFSIPTKEKRFAPYSEILTFSAEQWSAMTDDYFNKKFASSAIKRAGLEKIKNNIENF